MLASTVQITAAADRLRLRGPVGSVAAKRLAVRIATDLAADDGLVVDDALHVAPATEHTDGEIADAVGLVLEVDPALPDAQPIGVNATFGVVTLTGSLRDEGQRQRAEFDAWCVDGVKDVRNAIAAGG